MSDFFGGGSSQPNIVIPPAETPRAFQTIIPQKSYKDLAESMGRTEGEINRVMDQRYDQTGTAAELGAKQRGIEMQEAASYAASLPKGTANEAFRGTPRDFAITSNAGGSFDTVAGQATRTDAGTLTGSAQPQKTLAREAAETRFKDAKDYYLKAVEKAKTTPRSFMAPTQDPGFAQNPSDIFLPKKKED
tara:strand:+ start:430 stop:999 length:570 start_codon:yes stop_codon:yes gene_type:complete